MHSWQEDIMCLGVPVKIMELISGDKAIGDIGGVRREVDTSFVDISVGNYVILHAGFAIQKLDEEEAKETLKLFSEINNELYK